MSRNLSSQMLLPFSAHFCNSCSLLPLLAHFCQLLLSFTTFNSLLPNTFTNIINSLFANSYSVVPISAHFYQFLLTFLNSSSLLPITAQLLLTLISAHFCQFYAHFPQFYANAAHFHQFHYLNNSFIPYNNKLHY